jgi:hypothetical protein
MPVRVAGFPATCGDELRKTEQAKLRAFRSWFSINNLTRNEMLIFFGNERSWNGPAESEVFDSSWVHHGVHVLFRVFRR